MVVWVCPVLSCLPILPALCTEYPCLPCIPASQYPSIPSLGVSSPLPPPPLTPVDLSLDMRRNDHALCRSWKTNRFPSPFSYSRIPGFQDFSCFSIASFAPIAHRPSPIASLPFPTALVHPGHPSHPSHRVLLKTTLTSSLLVVALLCIYIRFIFLILPTQPPPPFLFLLVIAFPFSMSDLQTTLCPQSKLYTTLI